MDEYFSRTTLLIGDVCLNKLKNSRVAIFGIGGVGCYAVEALARSGIGHLDLIDNDKFAPSNLNRQLYATRNTLGKFKTEVAKERLAEINPDITVKTYNCFFTPETSDQFDFDKYDYIIDAIDTVTGKIELITKAKEHNVPIICSMGAGNKMHPEMFGITDISKTSVCPLAKVIRQELKKRRIKNVKVVYSKEIPIKTAKFDEKTKKSVPGSIAFVPSVVGLILAGEVVKDLIEYKN